MTESKNRFNDISRLKNEQYKNANNLQARMRVHELYSVATEPWFTWVMRHIKFPQNARVLELGAGTGLLWARNLETVPEDSQIILTDLSGGMLVTAKKNIGDDTRFDYQAIDVDHLEFPDNSFDIIIANHMLYHVPDVKRTLKEVRRLLKPAGTFYAATNGEGHMQELYDHLNGFDGEISAQKFRLNFVLENGAEFLQEVFSEVNCVEYPNKLHITETEPLLDYIYSMQSIAIVGLSEDKRSLLEDYFSQIISEKGKIQIRKHAGMFICR